jgi:hypothetical protein
MDKQCPDDARVFIRQRHRRDIRVAPRRQVREPSFGLVGVPMQVAQHRSSAVNQQRTKIGVSTLADSKQLLFATRGILARHKSKPSCKLPAVFERACITYAGHEGARSERPNSGNCLEPPTLRIFAMAGLDLRFEFVHLAIQLQDFE